MLEIKGLFFDVGGTVFDWKNTARLNIRKLADEKGEPVNDEAFANDWRAKMFKIHTQVRQGNLPWLNSDDMHLRALENMASEKRLVKSDHVLNLFSEVEGRLTRDKEKMISAVRSFLQLGPVRQMIFSIVRRTHRISNQG